jgi:putative multiple sugar transport system ATP-binding protein
MKCITKRFFSVKALSDVSFNVKNGEIHGIVGENGAGKSTLMNILCGVYPHGDYEGEILYNGLPCRFKNLRDSEAKGIVIIHQELALIPTLTVAENIFLGNERAQKGIINWDETNLQAQKYLNMVSFKYESARLIKDIGVGAQQLVEIAKALAKDVKLLILDEPTAALPEAEAAHLLGLLKDLQKQGITSILISHKLNEICRVADRVTILRNGQTVMTLEEKDAPFSEDLIIRGMVGREITDRYPKREAGLVREGPGFEIKNWNAFHPVYTGMSIVKNVSLSIHKGEVVGLYGLMGAGRTEMAMSVFGSAYGTKIDGELFKDGHPVKFNTVAAAIRHGVAYISEDRKVYGLVLKHDIQRNISLVGIKKLAKYGIVDIDQDILVAEEYSSKLNVKATSIGQRVESLSGGNQQKVVLAKWLYTQPDVLIMDEPTRGVDVGAKYEIYTIINELARQGKCILFISSDLTEILGMSDRVYVMNEGRISGELSRAEATQEAVMRCIVQ